MSHAATGLFEPRARHLVIRDLLDRARRRLDPMSDAHVDDLLEDAVYRERRRLRRASPDAPHGRRLDAAARAVVRGTRDDKTRAALALVGTWADEARLGRIM